MEADGELCPEPNCSTINNSWETDDYDLYDDLHINEDLLDMNQTLMAMGNLSGADLAGKLTRRFMENPEEMLKPWKINPWFVPIITTHAITFIVGLTGNVIVIATMSKGADRASRSVTSMFMVSLAVADLLMVAICAPLEALEYFLNPWAKGGSLCKLQSYLEMLSAVASVLNLTAVSLERYVVIVHPMKSRLFCTLRNCRRALIAVWLVSLALTAPVLVTRDTYTYVYYDNTSSVAVHYCLDIEDPPEVGLFYQRGFLVAAYQLLIMFVLPLLLMAACYSRVIQELWLSTKKMSAMTRDYSSRSFSSNASAAARAPLYQTTGSSAESHCWTTNMANSTSSASMSTANTHIRRSYPSSSQQRSSMEAKQARKQVIKMLILVIVLFLICWGPRLILNLLIKRGLSHFNPTIYNLRVGFYLLPFIHSCINPIVYSFMSSNFRRKLTRCCPRKSSHLRSCACCSTNSRTHSAAYEMTRTGLGRHTSAYCVSMATTELTMARNSVIAHERSDFAICE